MIYEDLEFKKLLFIQGAQKLFEQFLELESFTLYTHTRRHRTEVSYLLLPFKMSVCIQEHIINSFTFFYDGNHNLQNSLYTNAEIYRLQEFATHKTEMEVIWQTIYQCFETLSQPENIQSYLKNNHIIATFNRNEIEKSTFDFLGESLYNKYKSQTMHDFFHHRLTSRPAIHKHKI